MSSKLTDKRAIRIALGIAIDTELSLIDAYSHSPNLEAEPAVIRARKNIAAFKRVIERYFGRPYKQALLDEINAKPVSLKVLMTGKEDEQ